MRAITIKYLGPTNNKGPRVKASIKDGPSVTVSLRGDSENLDAQVRFAAECVLDDLGWNDYIIPGECVAVLNDDAWVAIPAHRSFRR